MQIARILKFLKNNMSYIIIICLSILCAATMRHCEIEWLKGDLNDFERTEISEVGKYTTTYSESDFKALKAQNKALYDSLKHSKDKIDYLMSFKYDVTHETDTIWCDRISNDSDSVFVYHNPSETDTLKYELTIGSKVSPTFYKLKVSVSDSLTIVNKDYGGVNQLTIQSGNGGSFSNVDVYKSNQKKKGNIFNRFSIGPSVSCGYDVMNRNFGVVVGVSLTYDLTKKK